MMVKSGFVREPSATLTAVVHLSGGRAWATTDAETLVIDHGAGNLVSARADPDTENVDAVVTMGDDGYVLRSINLDSGERVDRHHSARPLHIIGHLAPGVALVAEEHDGEPVGATLLTVTHVATESQLTHLSSADHAPDGRLVAAWGLVHPSAQRGYRGGGAGRIFTAGATSPLTPLRVAASNAADICVIGNRIYFIDDPDGTAQVFSVSLLNPTRIRAHTAFEMLGVTSLRRQGRSGLIVGRLGEIWHLDIAADGISQQVFLPMPPDPAVSDDRAAIERVRQSPGGGSLAIIGEGVLDVVGELAPPAIDGHVIDAAWRSEHHLAVLWRSASSQIRLTVHDDAGGRCDLDLPDEVRAHDVAGLETAGAAILIFGEDCGLWICQDGVRWRAWAPTLMSRNARPVLRADGAVAAWSGNAGPSSSAVNVVDVGGGRAGTLTLRGSRVRAVAFATDGQIVFASQRLSAWAGAVAPAREADVVCSIPWESVLQQDSRAVTVLGRGVPATTTLIVAGGDDVWASNGARTIAVSTQTAITDFGRTVGDSRTAAFLSGDEVSVVTTSDVRQVRPARILPARGRVLDEALRIIDRRGEALCSPFVEALRAQIVRCADLADVREVVRAALREIGLSHASLVVYPHPVEGAVDRRDYCVSAAMRERAEKAVADVARYVALSDVGPSAVHAVESLCRTWEGTQPVVLDLRFNIGGPFADYIAQLMNALLERSLCYLSRDRRTGKRTPEVALDSPENLIVIVNEATGSGGEHLAALLAQHPKTTVVGRRTLGAGTGFHERIPLAGGVLIVPQYVIDGAGGRGRIENVGVEPAIDSPLSPSGADAADDAVYVLVRRLLRGLRLTILGEGQE